MKKKLLSIMAVAAFVVCAGYNVYVSHNAKSLSDLALANIEALGNGESSGSGTLYGNSAGTSFCCCPGTNSCGAARCSFC